MTVKPKI